MSRETGLFLQAVMLVEHARGVRHFRRVIAWRLLIAWRRQAFPWRLHGGLGVQGGQQALASLFVQGQAVGTLGEVVLHFLIALSELLDQRCGAVEVGDHFILIVVKTFLNVIQLTLRAARRGIRQKAGDQETNGDTGNQGKSRQQPN